MLAHVTRSDINDKLRKSWCFDYTEPTTRERVLRYVNEEEGQPELALLCAKSSTRADQPSKINVTANFLINDDGECFIRVDSNIIEPVLVAYAKYASELIIETFNDPYAWITLFKFHPKYIEYLDVEEFWEDFGA